MGAGPRRVAAAALAALLLAACSGQPAERHRATGGLSRLDPIYDASVVYPNTEFIIGGLTYRGLELDLEIEFDDATVRDGDPAFTAQARILTLLAGGTPQTWEQSGPLDIAGTLVDGAFDTDFFGPIKLGTSGLLLRLTGRLEDGARRVAGGAAIYGISEDGFFTAIKRRRYLVAGTDFTSSVGKVAAVSVRYDSRFGSDDDLEVVSSDPVVRVEDGRPFVVNRDTFDNLQGLDPAARLVTSFQYGLGDRANPHDLAVAGGGEAFVTRYGPAFNDVAVVDLATGAINDRIDLAPYARNRDHLPRADQALLLDGLVYVTLLDVSADYRQWMNGRVVVIDPAARRVVDVIDLEGQNPFESFSYAPSTGLLYAAMAGIFPGILPQALTGGVEAIDPVTRRSLGLVVDDDALGGNVSAVAIQSAARGYCVVSDSSYRNSVKAFNPTTGEVLGSIFESSDLISDLEVDGDGFLLVAVRAFFEPRLLVFNADTGQPIASIPARLPPLSIAVMTRSL
jgi:DNA-binding beta-propeller fold protein YncE